MNFQIYVEDFNTTIAYLRDHVTEVTSKNYDLNKKTSYTINGLLNYKRDVEGPKYAMISYPYVSVIYKVLMGLGLFTVNHGGSKPRLQATEVLDAYEQMEAHDQYVFLVEGLLLKVEDNEFRGHPEFLIGELVSNYNKQGNLGLYDGGAWAYTSKSYLLHGLELLGFFSYEKTSRPHIKVSDHGYKICKIYLENQHQNFSFMMPSSTEVDLNHLRQGIRSLFPEFKFKEITHQNKKMLAWY